jgi:hypothetical protein
MNEQEIDCMIDSGSALSMMRLTMAEQAELELEWIPFCSGKHLEKSLNLEVAPSMCIVPNLESQRLISPEILV